VGSTLRIIALTSARGHARFGYTDFQMVVFVSLLVQGWSKRELVVSLRIGHAPLQECGDVVGSVDPKTSALRGDYLSAMSP
jgi:hypothetical protein